MRMLKLRIYYDKHHYVVFHFRWLLLFVCVMAWARSCNIFLFLNMYILRWSKWIFEGGGWSRFELFFPDLLFLLFFLQNNFFSVSLCFTLYPFSLCVERSYSRALWRVILPYRMYIVFFCSFFFSSFNVMALNNKNYFPLIRRCFIYKYHKINRK